MSELFPIIAEGAAASRRGKRLVGPLDLTLSGEGITVVIGPNGAGKTTLLRLLHGAARLTAGRVRWACATEEARHHQAFVFQQPVMLRRTVLDNLVYPQRVRGVARGAARAAAENWAARVGLGGMLERNATALSQGEKQKLALARALVVAPRVVFLDEPCAALDGRATREFEAILGEVRAGGTRLIMSTHHMGQARRLADDVIFLKDGRVQEHSPAKRFFEAPQCPDARAFLRGDIVE